MARLAAALLQLPNGLFVVQRRGAGSPFAPLKLGFFGADIGAHETPLIAVKRALAQETSLDVDNLKLEAVKEIDLPNNNGQEDIYIYVFKAQIASPDFEVYDGHPEVHPQEDIRSRIDLTSGLHIIMQHL